MNKIPLKESEKFNIIKFILLFFTFIILSKPLIARYGFLSGMHTAILMWTFFIICIPIVRGKALIGIPYYLIYKTRIKYPEIIVWIIALIINMLTLASSNQAYFRTNVTHLLYIIMKTPWPMWISMAVCAISTAYDSFLCNYTHRKTPAKHKLICRALIIISFFVTFILTYQEFIILVNLPSQQY